MGAPVPIFSNPDWRNQPGAELASVSGANPAQMNDVQGLAFDERTARWVSPRLKALQEKTLSVADLDEEELIRGQVRDSDGKFRRGPERKIPRELHDELMRRILETGTDTLKKNYLSALGTIVDLMEDTNVDDGLRAKLAIYVVERFAGKTPDVVQATVEVKPWERIMHGIIREVPIEQIEQTHIVVVEEEDK